jgi:hypothetical protein
MREQPLNLIRILVRVFFNNLCWILIATTVILQYYDKHLSENRNQNIIQQTQSQHSIDAVSHGADLHVVWTGSALEDIRNDGLQAAAVIALLNSTRGFRLFGPLIITVPVSRESIEVLIIKHPPANQSSLISIITLQPPPKPGEHTHFFSA